MSKSHVNNREAVALKQWLSGLRPELANEIFIDLDPNTGLEVGGPGWKSQLVQNEFGSETVICLLSQAWLASLECQLEFRSAEAWGKQIIVARLEDTGGKDLTSGEQRCDLFVDGLGEEAVEEIPVAAEPAVPDGPPVRFSKAALAKIRRAIEGAGIGPEHFVWPPKDDPKRTPYRGWEPFEDIDAGVFFGRDAAIARGLQELGDMRRWPSRQKSLFVVLSPSGSGKSSFLRAGLIPRLQRDDRNFLVLGVMRPESRPLTGDRGFAAAIDNARQALKLPGPPLGDIQAEVDEACRLDDPDQLYELFHGLLVQVRDAGARQLAEMSDDGNADAEQSSSAPTLVLPLDQAEELFPVRGSAELRDPASAHPESELFLASLARLFSSINATKIGLIAAATIRTDRYEKMQNHPAIRGIGKVVDELTPMPPAQFQLVINGPARRETEDAHRPLQIDPALVAELVNDAKGSDTLPLLALTLERLYTKYASTGQLTLANYKSKSIGGIREVVNKEIERILPDDPHKREIALRRLRAAFIPNLVEITDSGRFVRRRAHETDLPTDSQSLVDALVEKRLLVRDSERDGRVVVEVALESLFEHWDTLRGWLNEHTEDLKTVADIKRSAAGWRAHNQSPHWLLSGTRLANAENLAVTPQFSSRIADDSDFLTASRMTEDKTAARERNRQRVLKAALVATAIVAVIAVVAAVVAIHAFNRATREARDALASQLDTEASAVFSRVSAHSDIHALADTLAAQRLRSNPTTSRSAFYTATAALNTTRSIISTPARVSSVVFSPDGRTLASGSVGGTVRVFDVADPAHPGLPLQGAVSAVNSMAFSPDGRTLVSANADGTVRLWKITKAAHPAPLDLWLTSPGGAMITAAFSPGGRILASGNANGTVRLWDLTDPTRPAAMGEPITSDAGAVNSVAFSPDGRTLAAGDADGSVRLFNVADPARAAPLCQPLTGHTEAVETVEFSPDGHTLASGSLDETVQLWDLTDPAHPAALGQPLRGHTNDVFSVAFSPDGHTLASGSNDATVRLWDVTDPAHPGPLGQPLQGHTGAVSGVAFSPDGHTLASGSNDHTVRLWNLDTALPSRGDTKAVEGVAFSPDGHTLASGSLDDTVRLWNLTEPAHLGPIGRPVQGQTSGVESVAFGPDGHTLAFGGDDGTVRLWDVADPAHPGPLGQPLQGHTKSVRSVAFRPDGHMLASGSLDGTVRLWNVIDLTQHASVGQPIEAHAGGVLSVAFSPDGRTLAFGSEDGTVRLWDVTEPAHPAAMSQPLQGHINSVRSVAFSSDKRTLASGGNDATVRLWDVSDRGHPGPLGQPLQGHINTVRSVAFSPDGHTLVSGSADRTVRLWDLTDPAHAGPLGQPVTGHTGAVYAVAFSPDGHTLVSGSWDTTVRLWPTTFQATVETLCSKLTSNISDQDWHDWISPTIGYIKLCPDLPVPH